MFFLIAMVDYQRCSRVNKATLRASKTPWRCSEARDGADFGYASDETWTY